MSQCHGTARYAIRCRRDVRDGELTCYQHQDQDVSALVELREERDAAKRPGSEGS